MGFLYQALEGVEEELEGSIESCVAFVEIVARFEESQFHRLVIKIEVRNMEDVQKRNKGPLKGNILGNLVSPNSG